jgi:Esterase-like activity of phytase
VRAALPVALVLALAAGCHRKAAEHHRNGPIDQAAAARLFDRVRIDTDNGLSGIAVDDTGALWVESERDQSVYRIVLDGVRVASIKRLAVDGVPADTDLEAIAWLGPGRLAFGTESHSDDRAQIVLASVDDRGVHATRTIDLPKDRLGVAVQVNDGVEGLCGAGDHLIASIETTGHDAAGRWAPIVRIDLGDGKARVTQVAQLALPSARGKLSALECTIDPDGTAHLFAIERHFEIAHILRADLPPTETGRITPRVVLDLGPVLDGALNLEGLGVLPDGRVVSVVDNQYDRITGPNELLVFKPGQVP